MSGADTAAPRVDPPADAPASGRRLAHQPALDGIRAVAVTAVLLFHAGVPGFDGGYLGVSVFFTLSGFLITTLLIRERAATGRVAPGAFYARRIKRLLPASVLCLVVVAAIATRGTFDQVPDLRRQFAGAALQVYNWVQLAGGGSYGELFAQAGGQVSPLEHYWSLAIEEQFYWVWPLAFVGLAAIARRRGWSLVVAIGTPTLAFVAVAPAIAQLWGPDAAYWATPARVGEILTGAFAAAWVAERGAPRWARSAAPVCLGLIVVAIVTFPTVGGPAYGGWLPALSVVSALLLVGLQHEAPLRRGLSIRPLVALGAISYGVYLYHWPIFVLFDEERVGRGGVALLAVRLGLTLAAAIASYWVLERPVRRWKLGTGPALLGGLALTALALSLVLVVPRTGTVIDTTGGQADEAAIEVGGDTSPLGTVPTSGPTTTAPEALGPSEAVEEARRQLVLPTPAVDRPVRILVVGDSTAQATGGGLVRWAAANPDLAQVTIKAQAGCGLVRGGTRVFSDREEEISPACAIYATESIPKRVRELQPDVVMVMTTSWDVIDQRFEGTGPEAPTDPNYRRRIAEDFQVVTDGILEAGAPAVVWVAEPTVNPIWAAVVSPQEDPARHGALHSAMRAMAAADPERVSVADLSWWIDSAGLAADRDARPDGVHLSEASAERVATDWLGPLLLDAALAAPPR